MSNTASFSEKPRARYMEMTDEEIARFRQNSWDRARWYEESRIRMAKAQGFAKGFVREFVKVYAKGKSVDLEQIMAEAKVTGRLALACALIRGGHDLAQVHGQTDISMDKLEKLKSMVLHPSPDDPEKMAYLAEMIEVELSVRREYVRYKDPWDVAAGVVDGDGLTENEAAELAKSVGRFEARLKIAEKMRKKGFPADTIAELTGLSLEEAEALPAQ